MWSRFAVYLCAHTEILKKRNVLIMCDELLCHEDKYL